jgi:DNA-binding PadR family transcriptional regulator
MAKSRRPRMMFSCTEEAKRYLEAWADEEGRSTSNIIERIVSEAIAAKYSLEITKVMSKLYQRVPKEPETNEGGE